MKDQWTRVAFDVSNRILGADVELRDGSAVRIDGAQADTPVFRQTETGILFSMGQMLTNLLVKTNTRKQDLIRPAAFAEAFEKGVCIGKPSLDINFTPPGFALCIDDGGARDIKRIVFDVELTVRPKQSS